MLSTPADLACNSCGICCQVMYNRALLQEDEKRFFGSDSLELPCRYSKGGCLVYHNRSRICADYKCYLSMRLERGEIGPLEGRIIVLEAKNLISSIDILLMSYGIDPLKLINDMIIGLLSEQGRSANELIIEYEEGKYKNIPTPVLSNIERLHDLLVAHFYNDNDLKEHGIKRMRGGLRE